MANDLEVQELETKALSLPEQAKLLDVRDNATFEKAGALLLAIKDLRKKINETFDPVIEKAHQAHKATLDAKHKVEAPLAEAERIIKPRISDYAYEQEERRIKEEARLQEEARFAAAVEAEKAGE